LKPNFSLTVRLALSTSFFERAIVAFDNGIPELPAMAFVVTGIGMIAAIWLMTVEGLIAHALGRARSRRIESALMREAG
jgi:hypothetical protein